MWVSAALGPEPPGTDKGSGQVLEKSVEKAVTGAKPFELLKEVRGSLRALAPVVGSPGVGSEECDERAEALCFGFHAPVRSRAGALM